VNDLCGRPPVGYRVGHTNGQEGRGPVGCVGRSAEGSSSRTVPHGHETGQRASVAPRHGWRPPAQALTVQPRLR
jgi:hypothetical protein